MDHPDNLTEIQIDTIREISNIGMGNAATALSQMVDQTVIITVPEARLLAISELPQLFGGEQAQTAVSYIKVVGQVKGHLLIAFPVKDAHTLISLMAPEASLNLHDDELAQSAVQEIGNILASCYLRCLAEMTQLNMLPTVPAVVVDLAGGIIGHVRANLEGIGSNLVVVRTNFEVGGEHVTGHCIFIPERGSLARLLDSLGVGDS